MARFASQAKMGFYVTPVNVVRDIKRFLNIHSGAKLLDTCCGEGEALNIIAANTEAVTYGVELDKERHASAVKVLDNAVWGDALYELRATQKAFSLLWLNPPYDSEKSDYGHGSERLELKFLTKHWEYLQDKGVLVYIIPFRVLEKVASFLHRRCRDLAILSFPSEQYDNFEQIVVMCVKEKPGKDEIVRNKEKLDLALKLDWYEVPKGLPTTGNSDLLNGYNVEVSETDGFFFRSARLDPDEVISKVEKSSLWERVAMDIFPPVGNQNVKPLMPLREGHLAMLLSSGMMNGEVKGNDGNRLVVKGSVRKTIDHDTEETESAIKDIRTDRYEITVRAICFDPVEIITIK